MDADKPPGAEQKYEREDDPNSVAHYYRQYYGPPGQPDVGARKPRAPWSTKRLVTVITIVVVVVLGGCGLVVYLGYQGLKYMGIVPSYPPAKVHVGTALAWRELDTWSGRNQLFASPPYQEHGLASGDFDGDGDDEVATARSNSLAANPQPTVMVCEIGGGTQSVPMGSSALLASGLGAWDCNGDGTEELVLRQSYTQIVCADLSGIQLTSYYGVVPDFGYPLSADVDGDGAAELILADATKPNVLQALDYSGNTVWQTSYQGMDQQIAGDIDDDGQDELLESTYGLVAKGLNKSNQTFPGWPSGESTFACADLNGDGTDEIIGEKGYLDPASGNYTSFSLPTTTAQSYLPPGLPLMGWCKPVAVGDFDGDGADDIAVLALNFRGFSTEPTGLCIYDLQGSCTYYEQLGESVAAIECAQAAGQDYLVMMTDTRLLIYP